ncbi:MAG: hypothetical protein COA69_06530 [Robiginitomaculum sp.]|nr:MAG: hypothetical protein COA69_06530 [Robiginitomaculum sp.]
MSEDTSKPTPERPTRTKSVRAKSVSVRAKPKRPKSSPAKSKTTKSIPTKLAATKLRSKTVKPTVSKPKPKPREIQPEVSITEAYETDMGRPDQLDQPRRSEKAPAFNSVIHPAGETVDETPVDTAPKDVPEQASGKNTKLVRIFALTLVALLTLAAMSWIGSALFKGADTSADLQTQLMAQGAQLSALEDRLKTQDAQIQTLSQNLQTRMQTQQQMQVRLQALVDTQSANTPLDIETVQELFGPAVEKLEADFAALAPAFDALGADLNTRIDLLETGQTPDDAEAGMGTKVLLERLIALETGSAELQKQVEGLSAELAPQPAFPEPSAAHIQLPSGETLADRAAVLQVLIESFPRDKMLAAVRAQNAIAKKKPSWLQRTLSKHIKIRDKDLPAPLVTIDAAETALKNGLVHAALDEISKLNPPVRAAAADWIHVAKKAVKSIDDPL